MVLDRAAGALHRVLAPAPARQVLAQEALDAPGVGAERPLAPGLEGDRERDEIGQPARREARLRCQEGSHRLEAREGIVVLARGEQPGEEAVQVGEAGQRVAGLGRCVEREDEARRPVAHARASGPASGRERLHEPQPGARDAGGLVTASAPEDAQGEQVEQQLVRAARDEAALLDVARAGRGGRTQREARAEHLVGEAGHVAQEAAGRSRRGAEIVGRGEQSCSSSRGSPASAMPRGGARATRSANVRSMAVPRLPTQRCRRLVVHRGRLRGWCRRTCSFTLRPGLSNGG